MRLVLLRYQVRGYQNFGSSQSEASVRTIGRGLRARWRRKWNESELASGSRGIPAPCTHARRKRNNSSNGRFRRRRSPACRPRRGLQVSDRRLRRARRFPGDDIGTAVSQPLQSIGLSWRDGAPGYAPSGAPLTPRPVSSLPSPTASSPRSPPPRVASPSASAPRYAPSQRVTMSRHLEICVQSPRRFSRLAHAGKPARRTHHDARASPASADDQLDPIVDSSPLPNPVFDRAGRGCREACREARREEARAHRPSPRLQGANPISPKRAISHSGATVRDPRVVPHAVTHRIVTHDSPRGRRTPAAPRIAFGLSF